MFLNEKNQITAEAMNQFVEKIDRKRAKQLLAPPFLLAEQSICRHHLKQEGDKLFFNI